jgi:F-type H+-transporting ATPase subunit epsilon
MPLHLDIVTPEKCIFSDIVENVYLPGADGEMGILSLHAGLVTALQAGVLRYLHKGLEVSLAIGSGFAEVTHEKVIVLTDMALGEDEIDIARAEAGIKRAQEALATVDHTIDIEEATRLQANIAKASAALKIKRRHH